MKQWMRAQSETFRFTRATWGERSNFAPIAGGMYLAQILWTTTEALYQALKGVATNTSRSASPGRRRGAMQSGSGEASGCEATGRTSRSKRCA